MGYYRAGFSLAGIDNIIQRKYPFPFTMMDAFEAIEEFDNVTDIWHASPPCQRYSRGSVIRGSAENHADDIGQLRELLQATGKPYIIENVVGAPLRNPVMLCGSMFGLGVLRHRLFETYPVLPEPSMTCSHEGLVGHASLRDADGKRKHASLDEFRYITVAGHGYKAADGRKAMDIDWLGRDALSQAIPPAFTKYIGRQMISILGWD